MSSAGESRGSRERNVVRERPATEAERASEAARSIEAHGAKPVSGAASSKQENGATTRVVGVCDGLWLQEAAGEL